MPGFHTSGRQAKMPPWPHLPNAHTSGGARTVELLCKARHLHHERGACYAGSDLRLCPQTVLPGTAAGTGRHNTEGSGPAPCLLRGQLRPLLYIVQPAAWWGCVAVSWAEALLGGYSASPSSAGGRPCPLSSPLLYCMEEARPSALRVLS